MTNSAQSVIALDDADIFADLIKDMVARQVDAVDSAILEDVEDFLPVMDAHVTVSFGDAIVLDLDIGNRIRSLITIGTNKIEGFWSDGVVRGEITRTLSDGVVKYISEVSTSSGGTKLEGLTSAQAYINKGKAIQIVAETLAIAEQDADLAKDLAELEELYAAVRRIERERKDQARQKAYEATVKSLENDPELVAIESADDLAMAIKATASTRWNGERVLVAFCNPRTSSNPKESMKSVIAFNTSTQKRTMTQQFVTSYDVAKNITRTPSGGRIEKVPMKDLSAQLTLGGKCFIDRNLTDPEVLQNMGIK